MGLNLFLTGRPGVGKTTIIQRICRQFTLSPAGFMVKRKGLPGAWTAFYLMGAKEALYNRKRPPVPASCFAHRERKNGRWRIETSVFEEIGVSLLNEAPKSREIIIMDELGRFEKKAYLFQKTVMERLKSREMVLGVVKEEKNPFLDTIREREDVDLFTVDRDNREEILLQLVDIFSEYFPEK